MKIFFVLMISLVIFSCAKNEQAFSSKLYLDNMESLSPSFQNKIITVIQSINSDAGGELISFSKKQSHQKPLVLISGFSEQALAHTQTLEYRCLISVNETNSIVNNNNPIQTDLRFVILHEIGHCYNFNHDNSSSYNIMNAFFGGTDSLNPGEISIIINNIKYFSRLLITLEP